MNCRRCQTENPGTSRYCSACGALLTASLTKPKRSLPWYVFAGIGLLAVLAAAYLFLPGLRPSSRRAASGPPAAGEPAAPAPESAATGSATSPSALGFVAGRFAIDGASRAASSSVEAVFFDGAWTALPLWALMGATGPRLESPGPAGAVPSWVDWTPPAPLVLCRFDLGDPLRTAELAPFDDTKILEWRPLSGAKTPIAIETGPLRPAGSFRTFALFKDIEAPGVLVQEGRIVGWTFGQGVANGYLWAPPDGAGPKPLLSRADLTAALGQGSREAAFAQALAMPDEVADDSRLAALAAGFRGRALLSSDDLPLRLKPAAIASRMAGLAASMARQGRSDDVARALGPEVLSAAADVPLIKAAAAAYNEARGFDAAHRLLVDLRHDPVIQVAPAFGELDAVEVELAKSSLHTILNEHGYGGLEIFDEASRLAPDDVELRLLGVETAVLEKQWVRAEELLGDQPYANEFADKARTLQRLVEEGRRDEDSVTIRFDPGARLIPVYAFLNKKLRQKFFIDTGATTTIIPASAASALEIRIDNSTPVVGFQGVAGADMAFQVPVESIEIEGLAVYDIRVLVYDLGDSENAGLLGNDFLQHFQVDLDSIKGVLKLRKK
ncbi:MAG: retroviral-like aspartic protease family protein [Candidatus Aminicenantales bacterium]